MNDFLVACGFTEDPFESTNAEDEPRLGDYFVPPPYFPTVIGDPCFPKTHIVLAPRGSGKTAQRRMIEDRSTQGDFLCVTYSAFDSIPGNRVSNATWDYHVTNICRLLLVGLLIRLDDEPRCMDFVTKQQRDLLRSALPALLGPLTTQEFRNAVGAVKTLGDKAVAFWIKYGGPIALAVQALLTRFGVDSPPLHTSRAAKGLPTGSLRYYFEGLVGAALTIGYKSVYVLVDKADETPLTSGDAAATYEMLRPLLTDLPTLETTGVAFKFFLWDKLGDSYRESGGRPDRVLMLTLNWGVEELTRMLGKRLAAFSGHHVFSLDQLACAEVGVDLHQLIAHLAAGSPRNAIRLAKWIVSEHTRTGTAAPCLAAPAIWQGVRGYADELASELSGVHLRDLKRLGKPTFTLNYLANEVLHLSVQAARNKVQNWMNAGVVDRVGDVAYP
ncbi:MAG: P-loop ATPase, Sll1717 family, partial [Mycobacterium leprae]